MKKKKKRNAAAQVPREYLSAGLIGCILFIVAVTLIVCFSPVGESFLEFELVGARAQPNLYTEPLLSSPVTTFSRVHSFSRCLATFYLCFLLSLFLSFFVYLLTAVISSLLCIHQSFKRTNEQDQSEFLRAPRHDSFCRAIGLSSFILPPRYLALVVSHSSATFYVGFDHPLRRSNATLRMYFPYARESHRVSTSFTNAFAVPVDTDDLNATLRSQDCVGLTLQVAYYPSRVRSSVDLYLTVPPIRAKTRPCTKMTDRPSNHISEFTPTMNSSQPYIHEWIPPSTLPPPPPLPLSPRPLITPHHLSSHILPCSFCRRVRRVDIQYACIYT